MTNSIKAILLGVLEGFTEFIPVSSTGHLIIAEKWLQLVGANQDTFNIAIQLGAILAVVYLYWDFFKPLLTPKEWLNPTSQKIIIAILPALVLGAVAHKSIKALLFNPTSVAIALIFGGIIMGLTDYFAKPKPPKDVHDITVKEALVVGICQCAALWPGMSRSASCIVGGLWAKLDHQTSTKFSFIIAVPVMVAAVSYDILKTAPTLTFTDINLILIGMGTAFVTAIIGIKTFLKILQKAKLIPFALYRIALGVFILTL